MIAASANLLAWIDRAFKAALLLLALSAPLSIAATQTAWALALLFWIVRAFLIRPRFKVEGIDLAVLAFIGLTVLSSFFSYEPEISIRKLVAVSLVTIVYLVSGFVADLKTVRRMIGLVIIAGVVSVLYTLGTLAVGKNLKLVALTPESPFSRVRILAGDTLLKANGRRINSPDDLAAAVDGVPENTMVPVQVYRNELIIDTSIAVPASTGDTALRFGITEFSRGRDTRASGFFGHYTTYAEAIQLILSLAFGLLIVSPGGLFARNRVLLVAAVGAFCIALFLTVTRASWAGFLISAAVIMFAAASRRTILICVAIAIPLIIGGLFYMQQKRNVAFFDTGDGSTTWRMTVWSEGFDLLTSSPRHLAVGIGMDSIKKRHREWHLFDNGRLPLGHMHSTPLQIALERGIPTLVAWLAWMFLYIGILWRGFRRPGIEWTERGLLLGALGGTLGFLASGLVHYNWGDSEVVMIFYLLMGLSLTALRIGRAEAADAQTD